MADPDKEKALLPSKAIPKDAQVIIAMMKEFGISEYDPRTVVQLTEFVYRYATSILQEAHAYANSKKKILDVEDVRLALALTTESSFVAPPPRDLIVKTSLAKNYAPLPLIKPHCGLRLPPDRYCLTACNYAMKSSQKKKLFAGAGNASVKIASKGSSFVKRVPQSPQIAMPKVLTKVAVSQKTTMKPRMQISGHNIQMATSGVQDIGIPMEIEGLGQKRKRDEDEDIL